MQPPLHPIHAKTRVRDRYAVIPVDAVSPSRLPRWRETEARILAAPALGAQFVQAHLTVQAGGGTNQPADDRTQTFLFMLSGGADLALENHRVTLGPGGYAYIPHAVDFDLKMPVSSTLLSLRKRYEPASGVARPEPFTGNIANVPSDPCMNDENLRVQMLMPDELGYDLAMNLFTAAPDGASNTTPPQVNAHVMEHGIYFLEGRGSFYLGEDWMDVSPRDYIHIAPFCPHVFVSSGCTPAKYLCHANVNRDIAV